MNKKVIGITLICVVVLAAGIYFTINQSNRKVEALAQCLSESDAKFYGAFWCPHCNNQKKLFGAAADKLPYIECSTPDGKAQLPICAEAGIESYPTWVFADGTKLSGGQTVAALKEKTGC